MLCVYGCVFCSISLLFVYMCVRIISAFEFKVHCGSAFETGASRLPGRAASGGALAPESPCATRSTPECICKFFWKQNLSKNNLIFQKTQRRVIQCTPPASVPDVIGGLAVWRHNNNQKKQSGDYCTPAVNVLLGASATWRLSSFQISKVQQWSIVVPTHYTQKTNKQTTALLQLYNAVLLLKHSYTASTNSPIAWTLFWEPFLCSFLDPFCGIKPSGDPKQIQ